MHSREQRCYRQSCEVSHNVWFRMGLYQYSIYTELNVLMWHATYSQHPVTVYIIWALLSSLAALWSLFGGGLVLRIIDSAIVIIIGSYSSILSSISVSLFRVLSLLSCLWLPLSSLFIPLFSVSSLHPCNEHYLLLFVIIWSSLFI